MIYRTENGYVISSNHVWLPGVYADERTARYAFRFHDEELQQLQNSLNGGVITFEMLRELKQQSPKPPPSQPAMIDHHPTE